MNGRGCELAGSERAGTSVGGAVSGAVGGVVSGRSCEWAKL